MPRMADSRRTNVREKYTRPGMVRADEVFPHAQSRNVLLACPDVMTRTCILK